MMDRELTKAESDVLETLIENVREDFIEMLETYPDPYQAAAALDCTRPEMDHALSTLFDAPMAWMQIVPYRARRTLRRLGMTVF